MTLATELGMRPLVAHCHFGLGKLYRRTGKQDQGRHHLTTDDVLTCRAGERTAVGGSVGRFRRGGFGLTVALRTKTSFSSSGTQRAESSAANSSPESLSLSGRTSWS
jgi:hypothetical protein